MLKKKSEDRKEKREMERKKKRVNNALSVPSVLGKNRFSVGKEDIGFPGSLTLTVKSEGVAEGVSMAKKMSSKSARSVSRPCWETEVIESMVRAIEYHEVLAKECKSSLIESRRELSPIEDKLQREKLLLSDRQLMLDKVKLRLNHISKEEIRFEVT